MRNKRYRPENGEAFQLYDNPVYRKKEPSMVESLLALGVVVGVLYMFYLFSGWIVIPL